MSSSTSLEARLTLRLRKYATAPLPGGGVGLAGLVGAAGRIPVEVVGHVAIKAPKIALHASACIG